MSPHRDNSFLCEPSLKLFIDPMGNLRENGICYKGDHVFDRRYWYAYPEPLWEHIPYEEYINLHQLWHDAREVPADLHAAIITVQKDFSSPDIINLHTRCLHGILDDWTDKEKWKQIILDKGNKKRLPFAYWAYIKDIVPTNQSPSV